MSQKNKMFDLITKLYPINRCLTGKGVRHTLKILKETQSKLKIKSIKSGTKVFDWIIPPEWNVKNSFIITPDGKKICDYKKNNLHVIQYSTAVKKKMNLKNLKKFLYSIPSMPNAIPYLTSYYKKRFGFCISESEKKKLKKGNYKIHIDTTFKKGVLNYGEIYLPGKSKKEIFLSTNICHPSMANNELSGPVVTLFLSKWIGSLKNRNYSYRIIFIPETIGSISYLKFNLEVMKKNIVAGFNIVCVGDEKNYSYIPSRNGDSVADKVALKILRKKKIKFKNFSWLDRGSDERQYCAPGVDLPICSITKSKYGDYKEYHSSLDDLNFISKKGLGESLDLYKEIILEIEKNLYPRVNVTCEPFLSRRGLHHNLARRGINNLYQNILSYADGKKSLIEISNLCKSNLATCKKALTILNKKKLIEL